MMLLLLTAGNGGGNQSLIEVSQALAIYFQASICEEASYCSTDVKPFCASCEDECDVNVDVTAPFSPQMFRRS